MTWVISTPILYLLYWILNYGYYASSGIYVYYVFLKFMPWVWLNFL